MTPSYASRGTRALAHVAAANVACGELPASSLSNLRGWTSAANPDGDGKPDMIISDDCTSSCEVGVGYWNFYRGSGTGSATSSSKWTLPKIGAGGTGKPFGMSTNGETMGSLGLPVLFSTESDYNGDKRPDLYIANAAGNISPSAVNDVYVSTGTGFSTSAGAR